MCLNCGKCDHEPSYNGDDAIDWAEQQILFGKSDNRGVSNLTFGEKNG
jgi:hypothetical protein